VLERALNSKGGVNRALRRRAHLRALEGHHLLAAGAHADRQVAAVRHLDSLARLELVGGDGDVGQDVVACAAVCTRER